jgi:hypothetical protein
MGREQNGGAGNSAGAAEDKRAAASMEVTLSSQVITAALAVMAVEGAFITYVLDKRQPGAAFYILTVLSALLLIFSILNGGVGVKRLTEAGFKGEWGSNDASNCFGRQSLACLAGVLLLFFAVVFGGATKEDDAAKDLRALRGRLQAAESKNGEFASQLDELRSKSEELRLLKERVDKLAGGKKSQNQGRVEH